MTYFKTVSSFDDLKTQYRALALANHPDMGGDLETMKAINNEYDELFPVWKHRSSVSTAETAQSTRSEFYTQNGWKGDNYNPSISTKEIACIIREYVKDVHNDYRFSVRSEYNHLYVTMTEAPAEAFTGDEKHIQLNHYYLDRETRITEAAKTVMIDVYKVMQSYNYDDSDSMIDYFDTNFYISLDVGGWDKPLKIVPRQKKAAAHVEYETVKVTKIRTFKTLEPREIPAPIEFTTGQYFLLKSSFSHGCYRGAVYIIDSISDGGYIRAYKMGKGYKNVCKGDVRGNSFPATAARLRQWVEKGAIAFVELVEVTKTEEYTSGVRRPKKSTGVSTEVQQDTAAEDYKSGVAYSATESTGSIPHDYTITPDADTRDGSALWVVKFAGRMSTEQYKATAAVLKTIKGNYSRFKKGFIFRYDPTAALAELAGAPQEAPAESAQDEPSAEDRERAAEAKQAAEKAAQAAQAAQTEADRIEDASTDIIVDLRLRPGEYAHNQKYRAKLAAWMDSSGVELSESVISRLAYKDLQNIIRSIFEERQRPAAG